MKLLARFTGGSMGVEIQRIYQQIVIVCWLIVMVWNDDNIHPLR
jgi:hypothetical protein